MAESSRRPLSRFRPAGVRRYAWPAALALGLVVAGLHFWRLEQAPSGFFVDEAGIGYAAWGIAVDGRDEHGNAWPLFFQSFGDWKNPLEIYLVAAGVKLFGPTVTVIRAVPSALSLLAAALLGGLSWELFRRRWLAVATYLVAAVLPWLFVVGRLGFEAPAQVACLAGFLLFWARALRRESDLDAFVAGLGLGLSAYAYSTGRLYMLLLVLALVAAGFPWRRARLIFVTGAVAVAMWLPAVAWNASHGNALTARFQLLSIFNDAHSTGEAIDRFWRVYTSAFSPGFLFESAFFMQGGQLFLSLAPFIAVGLGGLWLHRREPFWRLVALGLLLAPVPAALTTDFGHQLRNLEAAPFWLLIAALGAYEGSRLLVPGQAWIAAALAVAIALEGVAFLSDYFTRYPERIAGWNEQGLGQAVEASRRAARDPAANGRVMVSNDVFAGDVLFPWYAGEDVLTYRRKGLAGSGAAYGPIGSPLPAGTVVLAGADVDVPDAIPLTTISIGYHDDWGRLRSRAVYRVWRSVGAPTG